MKKNNIFTQIYEKINSDEKGQERGSAGKKEEKKEEEVEDVTILWPRWQSKDTHSSRTRLNYTRNYIKITISDCKLYRRSGWRRTGRCSNQSTNWRTNRQRSRNCKMKSMNSRSRCERTTSKPISPQKNQTPRKNQRKNQNPRPIASKIPIKRHSQTRLISSMMRKASQLKRVCASLIEQSLERSLTHAYQLLKYGHSVPLLPFAVFNVFTRLVIK